MKPSKNAKGSLDLQCPLGPVRMILRDHSFQVAATGVGEIKVDLPAGLYTLTLEGGGREQEEILVLHPGQRLERKFHFEMSTVSPMAGSGGVRNAQAAALARLCEAVPGRRLGEGSRLVVFARNPDNGGRSPSLDTLSIIVPEDEAGELFLDKEAVRNEGEGWSALSVDVPPGGGRLRRRRRSRGRGPEAVDQSLWFVNGWTLMVILEASEESETRPSSRMVFQMNRLGYSVAPHDDERREVEVALELALAGLERHEPSISTALLMKLLRTKFTDPLLGVVGAHSLLQDASADPKLVREVLHNLVWLMGDAPDLEALLARARRRGFLDGTFPGEKPVRWPPLFDASYRALLEDDDLGSPSFVPGSLAERIASRRVVRGPWTAWDAAAAEPVVAADASLRELRPVRELIKRLVKSSSSRERLAAMLRGLDRAASQSTSSGDPVSGVLQQNALIRLAESLNERLDTPIESLEENDRVDQVTLRSLAGKLRVPVRAAWAAVKWMSSEAEARPRNSSGTNPGSLPGVMYFSPYHPDPGRVAPVPAPADPDDPQKGRWGGLAERPDRELRARVTPADPGWFEVTLEIVSTNPGSPLEGRALFHLHPTFSNSQPEVTVRNGKATLSLRAWGAFTVGAEADGGKTILELDLSELQDAPQEFRDR